MEIAELKKIVEALIFAADQPLQEYRITNILGSAAGDADIEKLVKEIAEEYDSRQGPIELRFIAGGWQFATKKEFGSWVKKLYKERTTLKLSNSALETLAVIAYKQPITRSEAEEVRGVEVSGVLETLLERKLVRIVGRKETVGRPLLYGTTQEFLKHFGLTHLSELPAIEEMSPPEQAPLEMPAIEPVPELPFENGGAETQTQEQTQALETENKTTDEPVNEN
jgi:segregation and condensation protein B